MRLSAFRFPFFFVIASVAKQSSTAVWFIRRVTRFRTSGLDCFVASLLAMTAFLQWLGKTRALRRVARMDLLYPPPR